MVYYFATAAVINDGLFRSLKQPKSIISQSPCVRRLTQVSLDYNQWVAGLLSSWETGEPSTSNLIQAADSIPFRAIAECSVLANGEPGVLLSS